MDTKRLLLLAEAADRGSLTAAAEALAVTTSAASQQISRLEAESGQSLLERLPRGVRLTSAGEALAERGRRIRRELRGAQADLESFARLDQGELSLGVFPTASSSVLPLALTRFSRKHPDIRVRLRSSLLTGLLDMLHASEVDMAMLWDYEWNRVQHDWLEVAHLLDDPVVLVVPANSEFLEQSAVDLSELADQHWITRAENSPVAEVLHRSCREAGFEPTISYESHDYQEAQAMVAAGLGLLIAPRLALTNRRQDVRLLNFDADTPAATRRILLAHPTSRPPSPAAAEMARILRSVGTKFTDADLHRTQLGAVRAR